MKSILIFSIFISLIFSCSVLNSSNQEKMKNNECRENTFPEIEIVHIGQAGTCIRMKIVDCESKEELIGVKCKLMQEGSLIAGAMTDIEGKVKVCTEKTGTASLEIEYLGYQKKTLPIELLQGNEIRFKGNVEMYPEKIYLEKPILYLYPDSTMDVKVEVFPKGGLSHSYPKYDKGWQIQAHPNGNLIDKDGKEYYALYWEGKTQQNFSIDKGFIVPKDSSTSFLEKSLKTLGLNAKERNEMIIYWLPKLEQNKYNLIHFSTKEYEEFAPLIITPQPETLIRVMMVFIPMENKIQIEPQDLLAMSKKRKGFTVVEWGGAMISQNQFELLTP